MPAISLARALRLKNRLNGRFTKVTTDIQTYNSQYVSPAKEGQEEGKVDVDVAALFEQRKKLQAAILSLKVAINQKNAPIQHNIYMLAEIKGDIAFLQRIPTNHGTEFYGTVQRERRAFKRKTDVDAEVKALEAKADSMLDEIDHHNSTIKIEVPQHILDLAGTGGEAEKDKA